MEHHEMAVKSKRPYDASRRQEEARRNRVRIIDAAERRFLDDGYAVTTIAAIANDAGVSADTIYKAFGGKPGLVRAIRGQALEGDGPVAAEQRSDALHTEETDPRRIIQGWGKLSMEVAPRVAPILLLIRAAAATDPDVLDILEEMDADRLARMTRNARQLRDRGHLRADITLPHAAEVLWTYSSPELYELLVIRRKWPLERYGRFVARAMIDALL
jgi:AcrR family transcriptional regulator